MSQEETIFHVDNVKNIPQEDNVPNSSFNILCKEFEALFESVSFKLYKMVEGIMTVGELKCDVMSVFFEMIIRYNQEKKEFRKYVVQNLQTQVLSYLRKTVLTHYGFIQYKKEENGIIRRKGYVQRRIFVSDSGDIGELEQGIKSDNYCYDLIKLIIQNNRSDEDINMLYSKYIDGLGDIDLKRHKKMSLKRIKESIKRGKEKVKTIYEETKKRENDIFFNNIKK